MSGSTEQRLSVNLSGVLKTRFNLDELRTLCFHLGIDYEDLAGSTKGAKVTELVGYCERCSRLAQLVSTVLQFRPDTLPALLPEGIPPAPQPLPIEGTGIIPFEAIDTDIHFLDIERSEMTKYYISWTEAANTIDIIALSMQAMLENYGDDRLIKWLKQGKKFRVLVLSPGSTAAKVRGEEEGIPLQRKIVTQIKRLKSIYERARNQITGERKRHLGSLEVRFYDGIPYFAYFGSEREIVIGLYYAQKKGLQSEAFLVDVKSPIYENLQCHFDALWDRQDKGGTSFEDRLICVISESKLHFMKLNTLGKTLVRKQGRHHGKLDR